MNKSLKRFLLMFAVLCVFVCGLVFAVACGDKGDPTGTTGGEPEQKVTYSVSVTTDTDLDLTTVKAQWKSGSQAVGDAIALNAEGKASVELESGDYTVDLVGVDADKYVYQPANVTATAPDATITITAKPPVSTSHNVIISVTVPAGITLPADAGVQLYKDGTAEGEHVTIASNTAMVTVPNGTGYTIGLVNLPDYLGWGTAQAVADSTTTLTFTIAYADVEYTVTVEKGNYADALTGVKVELWAAEATEATASADLTDGSATVTATAGTYTVKLNGLAADYGYAEGQVTIEQRSASITITGNEVEVTLTKNASASAVNFADLTVNFMSGDDVAYSVKPNSEGVAVFAVPAGVYIVEVSGLPAGYMCPPKGIAAATKEVELEICAAPERYVFPVTSEDKDMPLPNCYTVLMGKNINMYMESQNSGGNYISYEMLYIKFVAPEDGLYTFAFSNANIGIEAGFILPDPLPDMSFEIQPEDPYNDEDGTYILEEGENLWIVISSEKSVSRAGIKMYFDLTVTSAEMPIKGSITNPYEFDYVEEDDGSVYSFTIQDKTYTVEGASAYFALKSVNGVYKIEVPENITVYGISAWYPDLKTTFTDLDNAYINGEYSMIYFEAAEGTEIESFDVKVTKVLYTGAGSASQPTDITFTGNTAEVTYTFEQSHADVQPFAWFKLTVTETSRYSIKRSDNFESLYLMSGIDAAATTTGIAQSSSFIRQCNLNYSSSETVMVLDEGTYYFALQFVDGQAETGFTITKFTEGTGDEGTVTNPIAITTAGTQTVFEGGKVNSPDEPVTGVKYYKYTSTAETPVLLVIGNTQGGIASDNSGPWGSTITLLYYGKAFETMDTYSSYSFWRMRTAVNSGSDSGAIVLNKNESVYFAVQYTVEMYMAYGDDGVEYNAGTFDISTVALTELTAGATNTVTTSDNWQVKYYKYTAEKAGIFTVTLGGFAEYEASITLTPYSDANGTPFMDNNQSVFTGFTADDAHSVYTYEVAEGDAVYFTIDYKGSSATSFKFTAEVVDDTTTEITQNGEYTVGTGRETAQFKRYVFKATARGTLTITAESENIYAISGTSTTVIAEIDDKDGKCDFIVYYSGEGEAKIKVEFVPYIDLVIGENTLADAATEDKTIKVSFTPAETGYYTFTLPEGVTATYTILGNSRPMTLPAVFSGGINVIIVVRYHAETDTVTAPKLTVARIAETSVNAGEKEQVSGANVYKFTVPADGIYLFSVSGATPVYFNGDYDIIQIADSIYFMQGDVILVYINAQSATFSVVSVAETDIVEMANNEGAIANVTADIQTKVFKFTASADAAYEFTVTGTNVSATITLYSEDFKLVNGKKASLKLNESIYIIVEVAAEGGDAAEVKLVAEINNTINVSIGRYGADEYVLLGAATANTEVSFTLEAKFTPEEDLGWYILNLDFATDEYGEEIIWPSSPYMGEDELAYTITSITITGNDGSVFEDTDDGYGCMEGSPTSVTIECTITLTQDVEALYVGVTGMPIYGW